MTENIEYPIRINRYLELKAVATRRAADDLIKAGLVKVNGKRAVVGQKIEVGDEVTVMENKSRPAKNLVYLAYYKPRGIATHASTEGEKAINMEEKYPGVFPVGRLDKDSEGLMILTNDGRVTERLLHPRFEHEKEYVVNVRERVLPVIKRMLEAGVVESGEKLKAKRVEIIDHHTLDIILTSGKNHQIRRMLSEAHLTVEKLVRVRVMNIKGDKLKPGQVWMLTGKELNNFLQALGLNE
ncbi:MAG: pseudouridine synthase [Candidatus Paceibacterota bacterium]